MVENSELLLVPAFADLPDDQIAWFISQAQELHYKAGDTYVRQGTPADAMFVILEGQLELHGEMGGEAVTFSMKAGDVTGTLPFSRNFRPHCFRTSCRRCRSWPSGWWA